MADTCRHSVKGRPHYYSQKKEEYAHIRFDLDAGELGTKGGGNGAGEGGKGTFPGPRFMMRKAIDRKAGMA